MTKCSTRNTLFAILYVSQCIYIGRNADISFDLVGLVARFKWYGN
jgi:hypothetical protein